MTQTCYVCGASGFLVDTWIYVKPKEGKEGPLFIGQCRRCQRFICNRCGEKLSLNRGGQKSIFSFIYRKSTSLLVCCPFDPGVELGDEKA